MEGKVALSWLLSDDIKFWSETSGKIKYNIKRGGQAYELYSVTLRWSWLVVVNNFPRSVERGRAMS